MTLIVTVVTDAVIFQASDRRATWLNPNGTMKLRDDVTNKAILYENRFTFASTGFAELKGQRHDRWVADRLASATTLAEGIERVRADMSQLFSRHPYRGHGHTVMVSGWKREPDGSVIGGAGLITNHFKNGVWLQTPFSDFEFFFELAPANSLGLFCVPGWMHKGEVARLRRNLLRAKNRGVHVTNAIRLVVEAMREVADDPSRATVGSNIMINILPKSASATTTQFMAEHGQISADIPTFYYLSRNDVVSTYGPTFVAHRVVMSDFHALGGGGRIGMRVGLGPPAP